jgi:uncharacterized membrane protein YhaH (DUF805 family)
MNYFLAALQKYADFDGRASRSEYWYFTLFYLLISIVVSLVAKSTKLPMLEWILTLGMFIPSLSVGVRRMHDIEKSGWYSLIPFYNFYLSCIEGTKGDNKYGEDPWGNKPEYMPMSGVLDDKV